MIRVQYLFYLFIFLQLLSCSSEIKQKKVNDDLVLRQRLFLDELYMSPIASWSNYSDASNCKRENDWLYLNLDEVRKKTNLNYFQSLNLQYQLNTLWFQKRPYVAGDYAQRLLPADRLTLIEQALERVNGGVSFWTIPTGSYPIWLIDWDSINADQKLDFLTAVISHPKVKDVIPVIVSRCSSSFSIKSILELKPELLSFSFILGVELLTVFSENLDGPQIPFIHSLEYFFDSKSSKTWIYPLLQQAKTKNGQVNYNGKAYKAMYL